MGKLSIISLVVAVTLLGFNCAAFGQAPTDAETAKMLEALRSKHDLPALAVVVIKAGVICDRGAVGIRKQGDPTPVTMADAFHFGSCTKSMTATLAAMMIDEGQLRWDSTIAEISPELKGKMDKQYEGVTVEQLLQNRGGLPTEALPAAWVRAWAEKGTPREQRREFIEAVLAKPPAAAPGSKMIYSNQGYAIVGAMLETIADKSWEELTTEKLFKPLKMKTAGFGPPGTSGKVDQPWGHTRAKKEITPLQSDNPPAISPAGRVHCSLDDWASYVQLHLQADKTPRLLKPATLLKLHTPPTGGDYACGWITVERDWAGGTALTHNGSNTMWYAVMWLAPKKGFAVITATNIAGKGAEKGCDEVAAGMIDKWLVK